ncbi:hypothetical protein GGR51DRAFT_508666 [Nemania sp. FL0031]|nr:hypothetical protein GGR51DRAFT_508666 [Nemania sp. FL0031]
MRRAITSRWLLKARTRLDIPVFLCPLIGTTSSSAPRSGALVSSRVQSAPWGTTPRRCLHMQADVPTAVTPLSEPPAVLSAPTKTLPRQCRGCGALSQTSQPNQPGYFDLSRKAVQKYLGADEPSNHRSRSRSEDQIYEDALKQLDSKKLEEQGVDMEALALSLGPPSTQLQTPPKKPLCDRCHSLLHNHTGESIYHPSVESIRDTLFESPYKYNHVYHILDAADFPMSLVPKISQLLDTMPLRSKNRRSRAGRFYHGQKTEMSFIITRSDLLAPTKPQVDSLFPYLREVLREALGRVGPGIRLGNLRAVSAKRGWWTKELKEDVWKRGGGGWMLGKANVGKSQLFEAVFPKGRMDWDPSKHQITIDMEAQAQEEFYRPAEEETPEIQDDFLDDFSLLPPKPKEIQFPEMPLVSDLPGTTASPIRVPFGNGRGELIDLPGLERSGLESHVKKEHRLSLLMQSRIVPEQMTLKPGQSLLIGGFIRITPREPSPIMLSYSFTPIKPHVCRTDKAISIQNQTGEVNVENIAVPDTGEKTRLAGSFKLEWDVTKHRTGPLTRKSAIGLDVERLPYRVVSTDILIEGVGWVEIVAQVRTRDLFAPKALPDIEKTEAATEPVREMSAMEQLEAVAEDTSKKTYPTPLPVAEVGPKDLFTPKALPEVEKTETSTGSGREMSAMERLEALAEESSKKRKLPLLPTIGQELGESDWPSLSPIDKELDEPNWPIVDVYSPEGKFISCRRPMNGWMLNKPKVTAASKRSRPRKSMKGAKKLERKLKRERAATRPAATF